MPVSVVSLTRQRTQRPALPTPQPRSRMDWPDLAGQEAASMMLSSEVRKPCGACLNASFLSRTWMMSLFSAIGELYHCFCGFCIV